MEDQIVARLNSAFPPDQRPPARALLESLTLDHVMARSEHNLRNARLAALQLARGDLDELARYVAAAKTDFRDVIYWATIDNRGGES